MFVFLKVTFRSTPVRSKVVGSLTHHPSFLTSLVVDHLEELYGKKYPICMLYCSYKEHDAQSVVNLLASLVTQLATYAPETRDQVVRFSKMSQETGSQRPPLRGIRQLLLDMIQALPKVFMVIDALDEVKISDGIREDLISELVLLQSKTLLFVTARPSAFASQPFGSAPVIEVKASDDDIRRYLETKLAADRHMGRIIGRDQDFRSLIMDTIANQCKGM